MKILVTGSTGLIGRKLVRRLLIDGHEVSALTRSPNKISEIDKRNVHLWNHLELPPEKSLSGCDAVIHLAGEGIADRRWTSSRKKALRESRILGTKNLVSGIAKLSKEERPKILISGSAIGYYGSGRDPKSEDSPPGTDFLANLCVDWEKEAYEAEKLQLRTVILRTGLVLAEGGGLLEKSGPVVLGSGKQAMSWIHIDDLVGFIVHALENSKVSGAYNLTAPNPVSNREFTDSVAKSMKIPFTFRAPRSMIKLALGDMSEAVLADQRVLPKRTLASGFTFQFEHLGAALLNIRGDKSLLDNRFSTAQFLPLTRDHVFSFFARAENLETLTPPWLNFHILKKSTPSIEQGTLIDYKLNIHGVPVRWRTLISEWDPDKCFVDEQLRGPYKKWHHVHSFYSVSGGTLITDEVTFRIPGHIIGKLLLLPLIRRDVNQIFSYRQNKIKTLCESGKLN